MNRIKIIQFRLTNDESQKLNSIISENGFQDLSKYIRYKCLDSTERKTPAQIKLESGISLIRAHILKPYHLTSDVKSEQFNQEYIQWILEKLENVINDYHSSFN